jgi:hypothetical protein
MNSWPDPTVYPASHLAGLLDVLPPWLRRLI